MRNIALGAATAAIVALAGQAAHAAASKWKVDGSHSAVSFKVKHLMVTDARGQITGIDGKVTMDPADPTKGKVEATIDVATINTNDEKRDGHLKSPDFFDVANHPKATFKSKKITKAGKSYKVVGDLTLRGVTKEVTLDTKITKPVEAWGKTMVGIHAETTVNRKDFGISWNKDLDKGGLAVGNEVHLTIDLELHQDDGKTT